MKLDRKKRDLIVESLSYRKNFIETGNMVLSGSDAAERGMKVNSLSRYQRDMVNDIEDLIKELLETRYE